jgi:hypothetical protein
VVLGARIQPRGKQNGIGTQNTPDAVSERRSEVSEPCAAVKGARRNRIRSARVLLLMSDHEDLPPDPCGVRRRSPGALVALQQRMAPQTAHLGEFFPRTDGRQPARAGFLITTAHLATCAHVLVGRDSDHWREGVRPGTKERSPTWSRASILDV